MFEILKNNKKLLAVHIVVAALFVGTIAVLASFILSSSELRVKSDVYSERYVELKREISSRDPMEAQCPYLNDNLTVNCSEFNQGIFLVKRTSSNKYEILTQDQIQSKTHNNLASDEFSESYKLINTTADARGISFLSSEDGGEIVFTVNTDVPLTIATSTPADQGPYAGAYSSAVFLYKFASGTVDHLSGLGGIGRSILDTPKSFSPDKKAILFGVTDQCGSNVFGGIVYNFFNQKVFNLGSNDTAVKEFEWLDDGSFRYKESKVIDYLECGFAYDNKRDAPWVYVKYE